MAQHSLHISDSPLSPADLPARAACRVCADKQLKLFAVIEGKVYWRCGHCQATLLDDRNFPTRDEEHLRYQAHQNDLDDHRYIQFLSVISEPLIRALPTGKNGLDYGCGPAPALARLLQAAGHTMSLYDPFFADDRHALDQTYDFITCTETAEHFHRPQEEFQLLNRLLRSGGLLAVMTCFQTDDAQFARWHYRRDPTHVTFYRQWTFQTIAREFGWSCQFPCENGVFFRKS